MFADRPGVAGSGYAFTPLAAVTPQSLAIGNPLRAAPAVVKFPTISIDIIC
jgi:hypothetical protein